MIYYISDLHFSHDNSIRFDKRPFHDVDEMNNELVKNWNSRISPSDTVIVLGDAFWRNEEKNIHIFEQLNGSKYLIKGNHDKVRGRLGKLWKNIQDYAEIEDNGRQVVVCHYPILFYKNQHHGAYMLYGHVHNSLEWNLIEKWKHELFVQGIPCNLYNVGCMIPYMDYAPRTLDEIIAANSAGPTVPPAVHSHSGAVSYRKLWHKLIDDNLNLTLLARKAGVSSSTICKMKRGELVTDSTLSKIAAALDCEVEDIMEFTIAKLDEH